MRQVPALWDPLEALPPVPQPEAMKAAVLVALYEDDGVLRVVLTRRPDHMPTHPGDVVFPGGMIEPGDDGPVATALREAQEEIGLPIANVIEILGGLQPTHTRSAEMMIVPVVARIERPAHFVPEPAEVEAIIEPSIDELLPDASWRTSEWAAGRTMWFYEFPEGILWGATAHMVRELLAYFR
jgi:8-oxo-dGTP pyrophosphatase MutT (NUDIX family)